MRRKFEGEKNLYENLKAEPTIYMLIFGYVIWRALISLKNY